MSAFVHPTWIEGLLYYASYSILPLLLGVIILAIGLTRENETKQIIGFTLGVGFIILGVCGGLFLADIGWHYQVEEPSVQTKVITVDNWQPTFGKYWGEISGAEDLMLQTTDGELFSNTENLLFGKFNTRDILNELKPNGTYEIKYYGWREGFNSGTPNILSVEKVIDEKNAKSHDITHYMNKRSIIYEGDYEDNW